MPAFLLDCNKGMETDMRSMDSIALPLALAVLVSIIRSIRLLALPLLSIAAAVCLSFSFMYFMASFDVLPGQYALSLQTELYS